MGGGPLRVGSTRRRLLLGHLLRLDVEARGTVRRLLVQERAARAAGAGLALRRTAQEAPTDVREHAPGARCTVELRHLPEEVAP
ncbi:hypothetical protein [Kitasatospora purpeofusca]|uniref:hypothetical protein n=1 Tax=Kitasatospora purpeofusca TaxID=67352 RepID=UPI002A5B0809|nr:hypothetical protein [Kitasatospora purpeofusca]MDY0813164.1 hypothetical protein [Kitasatospora purpeofusca]